MKNIFLSVIIPTYHRNNDLALCMECLAPGRQTLSSGAYEVIVTDDGRESTAQVMLAERFPWAKWTKGPGRGPAANRNHGASRAKSEWLIFTDDDCLPSPGWLQAFWDAKDRAEVLEGLTRADREKRSYAEESPINLTGGYLWSCNFAIKKIVFENIGKFDENFPAPAMEDCDFRENLREAGIPFVFIKSAEVVHPWRPTKGWSFWGIQLQALLHYLHKHPHLSPRNPTTHYLFDSFRVFKKNIVNDFGSIGSTGICHVLSRFAWDLWTATRFRSLATRYAKEHPTRQV